ncbi:hypothetical protein GCM10023206_30300 [Acinetobacter puyangensis]|uniref:FimV domain-containing protein n=1 Tax=Acinetobacter puyangensis TaxID=1096779 RepID=A0A240E348_9GAMM|nr:hypothetical protein [Acinetobacter puyangensis]SNX43204.1 hypothetical protein SAMN05421731_101239 [Acinetobacter puyangensis]
MSISIIVILVIAIAVLLVIRAKQGQDKTPAKKTTSSSNRKVTKTPSKTTVSTKATNTSTHSEVPAKAHLDLDNLLAKLDLLIADRQYAKAEGLINLSLNQDSNIPELYFKLLKLYQLQDDNFAIKQLFDTVQKLNLNEIYQQLFSEHEVFQQDQKTSIHHSTPLSKSQSLEPLEFVNPKTTTILATAPAPTTEEPLQEKTSHTPQNNTIEFDSLSITSPAPNKATTAKESSVEQGLDFHHTITVPTEKPSESASEFQLEQPTPPKAHQDTLNQESLTFTLEEQSPAQAVHNPLPEFEFKLDTPLQHIDTASEKILLEDIATNTVPPVQIEISLEPEQHRVVYADPEDPIIQAFPDLTEVNPVDLDIDLAEQYIRLGEYHAAKLILGEQSTNLSDQQNVKIEQLLQKIA